MEYAINIGYFTKKLKMEMEEIAPVIAKAGFTALDYTPSLKNDDWKADTYKNLEICERNGLKVHQTHAPFNRYNTYGDDYLTYLDRAFEMTKIMKAQYMVVHGDEFDFDNSTYSTQKAIAYNYELFAPYVEKAAKENIILAFENVFQDMGPDKVRLCSKVEELKELIEKFHSENVCCCWDFGHGQVAFGSEQDEKIRYMGKLIKCTHIHDNYYGADLHLPPFLGDIDWKSCKKALNDINYDGNLSLELVYGNIPKALIDTFVKYLYESISYFNNL